MIMLEGERHDICRKQICKSYEARTTLPFTRVSHHIVLWFYFGGILQMILGLKGPVVLSPQGRNTSLLYNTLNCALLDSGLN